MNTFFRSFDTSIDLGGNAIVCVIGERTNNGPVQVRGWGQSPVDGLRHGQIDNLQALKTSLMMAVCAAECHARVRVRRTALTLGGYFFHSEHAVLRSPIGGSLVTQHDIDAMTQRIQRPGYVPAHIIPLFFSVDQNTNLHNPLGMAGKWIYGHFHIVWISDHLVTTFRAFFKECNITLTNVVSACVTDALVCIKQDQCHDRCILVNIGAYRTTVALHTHGKCHHQSTIAMGGHHVTEDIAAAYRMGIDKAEHIKVNFGAALIDLEHYHKHIPLATGRDTEACGSIPYTSLVDVVQARCQKMIQAIKECMAHFPTTDQPCTVYITGGGSRLTGIGELFQRILGYPTLLVHSQQDDACVQRASALGGMLYTCQSVAKPYGHTWPKTRRWIKKVGMNMGIKRS